MSKQRYEFDIPIGDWSGDGHDKCEWFQASAIKPFKDVCLAFKEAKKKFKKDEFSPENICSDYNNSTISKSAIKFLASHDYKVDEEDFYSRELADVIVWFINQGDPDLDCQLTPEEDERPKLINWEYSKICKEDLGQFGYGLLGD